LRGGGGLILKKNSCKAILNKKNRALTNWGKKYPAPVFVGEKKLQNRMFAWIDLTCPRRSARWFDFQGLV
jgi:hypothetical protein